ncbi:heavy-metal-associated domain-containing protein [Mycobacterium sp. CBMA247]|nr:heavy-metal-associated domain-containing protein [Mycolicibacterium sp. CBMA 329]MUL90476.1 heavy-metal-associated domain-containing protein [Mycolicibacterium sp. CBMA 331]MUM00448.1 heavy-metal-associated domain-containing protein [Mycolicibacterium sp. CBMA 334]MUM28743.1 heavy-metal-associated domain-containing protein [Mycolicibacterium sp. CBMA 295]MUM41420.1 heavy-metal-associated domain-containing protein [Mycolicibacterium sp. CBMA 247]MUM45884.1 heavy-metal-associated domain-conta
MSCGACSRRVENKLNKIDGVHASVAISTKIATIDARHDISVADLCAAVQQAGYRAEERAAGAVDDDAALSGPGGPPQKRSSGVTRAIRWMSLGHLGGGAVRAGTRRT